MITRIPAFIYRGGTSKGPLILASDLPFRKEALDATLLAAMGSPHKRQIDGIGGADILTSKVAIVSRSAEPGCDVDYLFAQVVPDSDFVDYTSLCGNMLSAVGPFAIEMGLVPAGNPETRVRIFNVNTRARIEVTIQTPDGMVTYEGNARIDGVPGTAAPVVTNFSGSAGAKTGKLFPTGRSSETIDDVSVTCIDAGGPAVLIPASALGKTGHESKSDLDSDRDMLSRMERIRCEAGRRMGLGDCSRLVMPKPLLVASPRTDAGVISSRDFVPDHCHAAHSVSGSIAVSVGCAASGTVANQLARLGDVKRKSVAIEHPSGILSVEVAWESDGGDLHIREANVLRTCRKLFEGVLCIPSAVWDGSNKASCASQLVSEPVGA